MLCTRCGQENDDAAGSCARCGRKLQSFFRGPEEPESGRPGLPLLTLAPGRLGAVALRRCLEAWALALVGLAAILLCLRLELTWPLYILGPALLAILRLRKM